MRVRGSAPNELTSKDYWEDVWDGVKLPIVAAPSKHLEDLLEQHVFRKLDCPSFLEIGCAPGAYMAYANRKWSAQVSGVEYAEKAAAATRTNLAVQNVEAEVIVSDVFQLLPSPDYDIVFSMGFVEHFNNTDEVIKVISRFSRRFVVTAVPNLFGVNGAISKLVRPDVYHGHVAIKPEELRRWHEDAAFETVWCGYVEGFRFIFPASKTRFFERHRKVSFVINLPFRAWNVFQEFILGRYFGVWPQSSTFSRTILYIGEKKVGG